jgi:hypothetical protein
LKVKNEVASSLFVPDRPQDSFVSAGEKKNVKHGVEADFPMRWWVFGVQMEGMLGDLVVHGVFVSSFGEYCA